MSVFYCIIMLRDLGLVLIDTRQHISIWMCYYWLGFLTTSCVALFEEVFFRTVSQVVTLHSFFLSLFSHYSLVIPCRFYAWFFSRVLIAPYVLNQMTVKLHDEVNARCGRTASLIDPVNRRTKVTFSAASVGKFEKFESAPNARKTFNGLLFYWSVREKYSAFKSHQCPPEMIINAIKS